MPKKTLIATLFFAILFGMYGVVFTANATTTTPSPTDANLIEYKLLEPLPCIPDSSLKISCVDGKLTDSFEQNELGKYISQMFKLFVGISIALAIIMISYGGFLYTTTDSYSKSSEGRTHITNAIYGLLMVLCAYLIMYYIDPRYVKFNTNLDPLGTESSFNFQVIQPDISAVKNFKDEESERLANISSNVVSKQAEYTSIDKEISDLEKELANESDSSNPDSEKIRYLESQLSEKRIVASRILLDQNVEKTKERILSYIQRTTLFNDLDLKMVDSYISSMNRQIKTGQDVSLNSELGKSNNYLRSWSEIQLSSASFINEFSSDNISNSGGVKLTKKRIEDSAKKSIDKIKTTQDTARSTNGQVFLGSNNSQKIINDGDMAIAKIQERVSVLLSTLTPTN